MLRLEDNVLYLGARRVGELLPLLPVAVVREVEGLINKVSEPPSERERELQARFEAQTEALHHLVRMLNEVIVHLSEVL